MSSYVHNLYYVRVRIILRINLSHIIILKLSKKNTEVSHIKQYRGQETRYFSYNSVTMIKIDKNSGAAFHSCC